MKTIKKLIALLFLLTYGELFSQSNSNDSTEVNENRLPVFSMDSESDTDFGSQDIAGLLQSSRDIFTSTAGFNFGQARFRIRGYDTENTTVFINNIPMNDMETGRAIWSSWGGLNDVTRYQDVQTGITDSREGFTGLGGYSSIEARASSLRPGTKISYAYTNRAYNHRVMATYASGVNDNGWSYAASGSRRYSDEGYVEGTYFDAWAYYLAAEKEVNDNHSVGFVFFGAPTERGRQGMAVQEAMDLAESNYYNPDWGYQNGKKRNARVANFHKPTAMLSHYWEVDEMQNWNTTAYVNGGRGGVTRLNWYEAADPRPSFWRYLPSFYEEGTPEYDQRVREWQNDESARQINWDEFYHANRKNLFTVEDADGIEGNTVNGARSKFILEEMRYDHIQYGGNSIYENRFSPKTVLTVGANINVYKGNVYRQINDLLGGDFWLDIDQFAERDLNDEALAINNVDNPNALLREGDRFGFDYINNVDRHTLFSQIEHDFGKWEVYGAANYTFNRFWRDSKMQNSRFGENSFGESEKQIFHNYGLKGGATFKISGRQYITSNALLMTRAPSMRDAYVSPRSRHDVVPGLTNETVFSGDINYFMRYPKLKLRASLYYTEILDQIWMRSFYHDEYRTFVNYSMTGLDNLHMGGELGVDWSITSTLSANFVLAHGQSLYNSRPNATISRDNDSELIAENRTVYLKNFRIGGMPQTAAAIGFRYNSPKYWFVGATLNYFDHIYLDPNPDRRTEEALENYVASDPQWEEIVAQERLDPNFTIDFYGGKSWKIKKHYLRFNVSVSNLLNNQDFRIGGFEQLRYQANDIDKFPPMYSYLFGLTVFGMVSWSF